MNIANPNPERVGCPSRDVLIALTRRERPIGDLRKYAVARSQEKADERPPVSLPRGRLSVILLPVGSEPGAYEVQVLTSHLQSKASANGEAEIRDYVTTLRAMNDLGSVTRINLEMCGSGRG